MRLLRKELGISSDSIKLTNNQGSLWPTAENTMATALTYRVTVLIEFAARLSIDYEKCSQRVKLAPYSKCGILSRLEQGMNFCPILQAGCEVAKPVYSLLFKTNRLE